MKERISLPIVVETTYIWFPSRACIFDSSTTKQPNRAMTPARLLFACESTDWENKQTRHKMALTLARHQTQNYTVSQQISSAVSVLSFCLYIRLCVCAESAACKCHTFLSIMIKMVFCTLNKLDCNGKIQFYFLGCLLPFRPVEEFVSNAEEHIRSSFFPTTGVLCLTHSQSTRTLTRKHTHTLKQLAAALWWNNGVYRHDFCADDTFIRFFFKVHVFHLS